MDENPHDLVFSDLNVWIALSVSDHRHSRDAWQWVNMLPAGVRLIFSRYKQVGLLEYSRTHGYPAISPA